MVSNHKWNYPIKILDRETLYNLCCQKIVIRLTFKKVNSEIKSSDSVNIQVPGVEIMIQVTQVSCPSKISISCNPCVSLYVSTLLSGWVDWDILGLAISYLSVFGSHGDTGLSVSPFHETILVSSYRVQLQIKGWQRLRI